MQSRDPQLEGLIVRNIFDLEAALVWATEEMDSRLWREMARIAENAVDKRDWQLALKPDDEEIWIAARSWRSKDSTPDDPEFSLTINEVAVDKHSDGDKTWLAALTGGGPNGAVAGLVFSQELLPVKQFKNLLNRESDLLAGLHEKGFRRDASSELLYLPISIDRESLACAFEQDDFYGAMAPLGAALKAVTAARKELDVLVDKIRREEKAK